MQDIVAHTVTYVAFFCIQLGLVLIGVISVFVDGINVILQFCFPGVKSYEKCGQTPPAMHKKCGRVLDFCDTPRGMVQDFVCVGLNITCLVMVFVLKQITLIFQNGQCSDAVTNYALREIAVEMFSLATVLSIVMLAVSVISLIVNFVNFVDWIISRGRECCKSSE